YESLPSVFRERLMDEVTPARTQLFRYPAQTSYACRELIPRLEAVRGRPLRIWSAGCSSGEEPFSVALALNKTLKRDYQILATDMNDSLVAYGNLGVFRSRKIKKDVPNEFQKEFVPIAGKSSAWKTIGSEIRRRVEFKVSNLKTSLPPAPGSCDVIFCRNVL